jgi:hypothetical protein
MAAESGRKGVIIEGAIWVVTILVFGFVFSYSDPVVYGVITIISGIVQAVGIYGLIGGDLPYMAAIVSFIPSAGWGIVMPFVAMMLDSDDRIDLTFNEITLGMIQQVMVSIIGFTILIALNAIVPISDLLSW